MEKVKLEIDHEEASELMLAIALRIEQAKSYIAEDRLMNVAKQLEEQLVNIRGEKAAKNLLARIRYGIKRVTVSFYESNPKPKPEGL